MCGMMKNKKSQAVFVGIMIAIMVFITVVILIEPLKEQIIISRDADHLDCTNSSISTGQRMTCLLVDLYLFYFVGACIAAGASYIFIKKRAGY